MPIERKNSFHLLLSDDEMKLLKLLAEREGLNASDYLRMVIRTVPSTSTQALVARVTAALGSGSFAGLLESHVEATKLAATGTGAKKRAK